MSDAVARWNILTGEFPPACGGVGDYTAAIARALAAAGDRVTVFTPLASAPAPALPGVRIVTLPDGYGASGRRQLDARLDAGARVLVQYVPNAFGARGANLAWCRWLRRRALAGADVRVMFHEPYFYFRWTRPRSNALAIVQRVMAATLLDAASGVFLSTEAWRPYLSPYARTRPLSARTLPIPSAIPRAPRPPACERDGCRAALVGHFGTYGSHIAPLLRSGLTALLDAEPSAAAICIGAGSDRFVADLAGARPDLRLRLTATGRASPHAAAAHILACDLMLQPYPDGVTTRRTSVMACLINGRAVVTTGGALTEPEWAGSGAVALVPSGDPRQLVEAARALLADGQARAALGARGEAVYRARFALEHTITALRGRPAGAAA